MDYKVRAKEITDAQRKPCSICICRGPRRLEHRGTFLNVQEKRLVREISFADRPQDSHN